MQDMKMKILGGSLLVCLGCLFVSPLDARVFTDVKGRKIKASIVNVSDDRVEFKMDQGSKTYKVPI